MTRRMTNDEFLVLANARHGDKYCYDKSVYEISSRNIVITCKKHGDFNQSPNSHLAGRGCRKCGMVTKVEGRRKTIEQFITDAKMVHGENYTYDRVIYQNSFIKICVTCALHGDFWIAPDCLLSGQRCYECSLSARGLKRRKTFDDFLEEARETHGDKYSYDRDSYRDASTKMIIVCPYHGDFEQIPKSHLTGRGCSDCADTGFNPNRQAYVYCLKSSDGAFVKVGITGNMATRMATLKCLTPFEFEQVGTICVDGFKAREIEKRIHNGFMSAGLSGFQGCTEWLRHDERIISMFV